VIARFRREAQAAGRLIRIRISCRSTNSARRRRRLVHRDGDSSRVASSKTYFQANERFTTADIVRIMTKLLDALDYSHRQGVIHRDIKPANIILLPDGAVKVADLASRTSRRRT
jgi:serine/threonine-protein kinase